WPRRSARRWHGACRLSPGPATRRPRPAGQCERNFNSRSTLIQERRARVTRALRVGSLPCSPYRGTCPRTDLLLLDVAHDDVFSKDERRRPRSPHRNRRAIRLVISALFVAIVGAIAAPGLAVADPISDKRQEAAALEAQINSNAEKLSALNEQMHSTQN